MYDLIAAAMPYVGLFGIAFLAATIVPAQSELALGAMLLSGRYDTALLLITATAGNTLGSAANWLHPFKRARSPIFRGILTMPTPGG